MAERNLSLSGLILSKRLNIYFNDSLYKLASRLPRIYNGKIKLFPPERGMFPKQGQFQFGVFLFLPVTRKPLQGLFIGGLLIFSENV